MNPISPTSLFHFTSSFDTLLKIIKNGFRYSYAFERFSGDVLNDRIYDGVLPIDQRKQLENCGIAIPMVSFCDIPITRTLPHAEKYGKYFIGLDKGLLSYMLNPIFNPVIYGISNNLVDAISFFSKIRKQSNIRLHNLYQSLHNELESIANSCDFTKLSKDEVMDKMPSQLKDEIDTGIDGRFFSDFLLALYKPVQGKDVYGNECYFYDEREWRAIAMDGEDENIPWIKGCSAKEYLNKKDSWNDGLSLLDNAYIKLLPNILNHISHIGVAFEGEVEPLANFIANDADKLFGCEDISNSSRLELISKITSFERIENDY